MGFQPFVSYKSKGFLHTKSIFYSHRRVSLLSNEFRPCMGNNGSILQRHLVKVEGRNSASRLITTKDEEGKEDRELI